ncbi:MAG: hypothetical protein IKG85_02125 [Clostridia bacterium]|nr:hypothetical protein [Clostridia bacterium]
MRSFIEYLDGKLNEGRAEIERLSAEGRKDDADFAKVSTNIYEVCKTVSQALISRPGAGVSAIGAKFEHFRASWGAALDKAKQHDDAKAVAVEEIKLAALDDVIAHFQEVKEA